jgi:predicted dinucleotide-binding enzyme
MNKKPVIGILGAGKLSVVLSQLITKAGYTVYVSNSKDPKTLALTFSVLAPEARVVTHAELIEHSQVIILALPLSKYKHIPAHSLDGKIVIDAMNYWWEVDGSLDAIHPTSSSSSEQVQSYFSGAVVVKALNHVGYHDLHDHAAAKNAPHRRSVAIAGNNEEAISLISTLIDAIGFDPLVIGELSAGKLLEPGSNTFGASVPLDELKELIKQR